MKPTIAKITDEWIKENNPCLKALDWWDKKEREPVKILKLLIRAKKYACANWFIVQVMEYKDCVSYAVFAAEQVIGIFEKKYPDDKRPRQAIEAAKKCIKDPSKKNKAAARGAARAAARAARAARAAARAAWAAARAAGAVGEAAWAACEAARAAGAAARAVGAAMKLKILKYGMKLLSQTHKRRSEG